jgi:hypothetical protein
MLESVLDKQRLKTEGKNMSVLFEVFLMTSFVWNKCGVQNFIINYHQNLLLNDGIGLVKMSSEENIGKRH